MTDKAWLDDLWISFDYWSSCTYEESDSKKEQIRIPKFDYQDAFEIGIVARNLAKEEYPGVPVVIDISLRNGHSLFKIVNGAGSLPDDDNWIKRNRETAMRFGCSSFSAGRKFNERLMASEGIYYGPYSETYQYFDGGMYQYFDGGAVPIFTDSCEFPVACLTISGLEQYRNHWLAVQSLRGYIIKINDLAGKYTVADKHVVECGMCLSEIHLEWKGEVDYLVIPCKHVFHDKCLKYWTRSRRYGEYSDSILLKCPVCKPSSPQR